MNLQRIYHESATIYHGLTMDLQQIYNDLQWITTFYHGKSVAIYNDLPRIYHAFTTSLW